MKKITKILMLGLIFALTCSVSFAAPPDKATITEFKKDVCISIDQAIVPAENYVVAFVTRITDLPPGESPSSGSVTFINFEKKNKLSEISKTISMTDNIPINAGVFDNYIYKFETTALRQSNITQDKDTGQLLHRQTYKKDKSPENNILIFDHPDNITEPNCRE